MLLTGAGLALLPKAYATLEAARDAVLANEGRLHGTLHIGGMTSVSVIDIPALLGRYHTEHPSVSLRLHASPHGSAGLAQSLLAGDLDVAFVSLTGRVPAGLTTRGLAAFPMTLVAPRDHRLARRGEPVVLRDLADEQFIDSPVGYGNRDLVDRAFAAAGVSRRVALEVMEIATTAAYVRQGLGLAFLPEFVLSADSRGLGELPVDGPPLMWLLSVAVSSKRQPTAPLRALLDLIDRYLSVESGPDVARDL
ncbi:LysR substrate-binding domain-containing protein [Streptomyces sp. AK02-01A]|uniref:LysR substrate-binding domain-containing protein n=1 Tax=Streptomyces sp. AK02-01A TaxID=3028648 RepID=UPI0029A7C28A|nr:LysR substrate-binding domain-containing protein [Streptomyces sp. AK02-01A]MDX3852758.1 LysR substrate-binding domain-containing protein [Streptomyces sp. AK02-01A]